VGGGCLQGELDAGQVDADVLHYALEPLEDTPLVVLRVKLGVMVVIAASTLGRNVRTESA
jgi:hypothetical protein